MDEEKQVYQCPGESYTITRAIHLARLAHLYPKCKNCVYNDERDLVPGTAEAVRRMQDGPKIFKAYDIRGIYLNDLNRQTARQIGQAVAQYLADLPENRGRETPLTLVVGRDMRTSSPELAEAVSDGVRLAGANVIDVGMVTTPACNFGIVHLRAQGGIMVTASHNPSHYNGFKVSREEAIPLSYEKGLADVERLYETDFEPAPQRGQLQQVDITGPYLAHLSSFAEGLKQLKVVVDAGNGMAGKFVPLLLDKMPCHLVPLYLEPDGTFPNHEADPLKIENVQDLIAKIKSSGADVGFAFDGDGDRCAVVDERGNVVGCDMITALLARDLLARSPGSAVVYDLRSSWSVREEIERAGGVPIRERVGHALIKATMRRHDAVFGGELSGHYYFRDNAYCDSGLVAMIHVLNLLSRTGKPMSELVASVKRYHQTGEMNFKNEDKDGTIKLLAEAFANGQVDMLDGITVTYRDWWFNVRKSNTEPLLRLNLEGRTRKAMNKGKQMVIKFLGEPIGPRH